MNIDRLMELLVYLNAESRNHEKAPRVKVYIGDTFDVNSVNSLYLDIASATYDKQNNIISINVVTE